MSRYRPLSAIHRLVIHCADTPNGKAFTAKDINAWHKERGFRRDPDARTGAGQWHGEGGPHAGGLCCIGYHFVIRVNGVVEVGRRLTETGAHEQRANRDGIGVVLIGTDRFAPVQWEMLRRHVESTQRWRKRSGLPDVQVTGHRELDRRRACPGFDVQAWQAGGMAPLEGHVLEDAA